MAKIYPQLGDRVIYFPSANDIQILKDKQTAGEAVNVPEPLEPMSAVVVAVWGVDNVNLKVHVDGAVPDFWATSVPKASDPRHHRLEYTWCWVHEVD